MTISDLSDTAEIDAIFNITANLKALTTGFHRWNLRVAFQEAET